MSEEFVPDNLFKCFACQAATVLNEKETLCNFHEHYAEREVGGAEGLHAPVRGARDRLRTTV